MRILVLTFLVAAAAFGQFEVSGYSIQMASQTIEIEGVCKVSESDAQCWRPNGDPSPEITKMLISEIEIRANTNPVSFEQKFGRKTRILILKKASLPSKLGAGSIYSFGGMSQTPGSPSWIFSFNTSTPFDPKQPTNQIFRDFYYAVIPKEMSSTSLSFPATVFDQKQIKVPLKPGSFMVGKNLYEIRAIQKLKNLMRFELVQVDTNDPNQNLIISPANSFGSTYTHLDEKGDPLTREQEAAISYAQYLKFKETEKDGKPFPWKFEKPISQTQMNCNWLIQKKPMTIEFPIDSSKLTHLMLTVGDQQVLSIQNVAVDPRTNSH